MIQWIIPLSILIFFEATADIFSKNWSLRGNFWLAVSALAAYLVANIFWLFALKNGSGLGRGAVIFSVASAAVALLLGLVIYKEPVRPLQIAGLVLGVASLVLIFWE